MHTSDYSLALLQQAQASGTSLFQRIGCELLEEIVRLIAFGESVFKRGARQRELLAR
ncbi:hypothetical protein D7241_09535 [Stutzerimonas sp. VN223-3]|uniref:hypothetical protein n=1 Tax=Stutzerimonas sp. VN223-3 TaxID=3384601 RepID=UPI0038B41E9A